MSGVSLNVTGVDMGTPASSPANKAATIEEIINDSMTRDITKPKPREVRVLRHRGKVSVLTGMRRSGKTWLCC